MTSPDAASPTISTGARSADREGFARRMHRRQQVRRGLAIGGIVVAVASAYFFLGSWIQHYRAAAGLRASGFAVDWRPDRDRGFWQGASAVHCTHHFWLSRPHDDEVKLLVKLKNVDELNLAECTVSEASLADLGSLPELADLNLSRLNHLRFRGGSEAAGMGDGCLAGVQKLTQLRRLSLAGNRITDDGLTRLSGLTGLEDLDLMATDVTDAGLEHLHSLRKLVSLNLAGTRVTPAGISRFKQAHPDVEILLDIDPDLGQALQQMRTRQP